MAAQRSVPVVSTLTVAPDPLEVLRNGKDTVFRNADFVSLERKLIQTLRESIQLQQDGATESEVRKSAENAKGPIKEFLGKWKTDQRVEGSLVWLETAKAIEELGQYYIRRGQRAALDKATAASILTHLESAESVLPPEEAKKRFGLF